MVRLTLDVNFKKQRERPGQNYGDEALQMHCSPRKYIQEKEDKSGHFCANES